QGNLIGLGRRFLLDPPFPLGNELDGVLIDDGASTNFVTDGNTISANMDNGIEIRNAAASNTVAGNFIGTDPAGKYSDRDGVPNSGDELGNLGAGVMIDGASLNRIGLGPSNRNVISGNLWGVYISPGSDQNKVDGNWIGTTKAGDAKIPNKLTGVVI